VLEWLDSHGSVFLNKNTAIGKSLQKAKALQKNFEHFEMVAQVLYAFMHMPLVCFLNDRIVCILQLKWTLSVTVACTVVWFHGCFIITSEFLVIMKDKLI